MSENAVREALMRDTPVRDTPVREARLSCRGGQNPWVLVFQVLLMQAVSALILTLLALALAGCGGSAPPPTAAAAAGPAAGSAGGVHADGSIVYPKWQTTPPAGYATYNQRANLQQRGFLVYNKYCVGCHGELGDGKGRAAVRLKTQPRDFTRGIYKFRSTDSGSLPLEADLYRTITRGLARVSMPSFNLLPESDRVAVIEYIKTFYPRWELEKTDRRVIPLPLAPGDLEDPQRVLRGRVVYLQMQCWKCHGVDGRGSGATQTEYIDAWGQPQRPFDFTRGSLKGGNSPEDIYRTFHTGLRSIMPAYEGDTLAAVTAAAFADLPAAAQEAAQLAAVRAQFPVDGASLASLSPPQRLDLATRNSWDLVAYILSLRIKTTTAPAVLGTPAG